MSPATTVLHPDYDLICIGFGPAALAIAVAIHDLHVPGRVLFLEGQKQFAWHAGMLFSGAKMQISFLKDLATFRDPRSHFTFLNYLKQKDRLEAFTNLNTFLPFRTEFNDYLTWAAKHFRDQVHYDTIAQSIEPLQSYRSKVIGWKINACQEYSRQIYTTRNLIIATGGLPQLPPVLRDISPKIIHSSHYLFSVPQMIPSSKPESDLNLVLIGGGQSSAESFHDLTSRYPNAQITLYTAASALKPSDDSPFVNEIFNPSLVSTIYNLPSQARKDLILTNRATNYSVVRPELLDNLYEAQYIQRLNQGPNPTTWKHRILNSRRLIHASVQSDQPDQTTLTLSFENILTNETETKSKIDLLICGTGYSRNGHETLMQPIRDLLASESVEGMSNVDRDYKLRFRDGVCEDGCGIWLQGVCEGTHGLSDSLLSILAVRAGEVVESVFGKEACHVDGRNGVSLHNRNDENEVKGNGHVTSSESK